MSLEFTRNDSERPAPLHRGATGRRKWGPKPALSPIALAGSRRDSIAADGAASRRDAFQAPAVPAFSRMNCVGDRPTCRVNATLKVLVDP